MSSLNKNYVDYLARQERQAEQNSSPQPGMTLFFSRKNSDPKIKIQKIVNYKASVAGFES